MVIHLILTSIILHAYKNTCNVTICVTVRKKCALSDKCIVTQHFNLRPCMYIYFVRVIKFNRNRKYTFYCTDKVILSPDNMTLIYGIKIDHVLL